MNGMVYARFERVNLKSGPGDRGKAAYKARCSHCDHVDFISISGKNISNHLPEHFIEKRLTQRGWLLSKHADRMQCPACATRSKPQPSLAIEVAPQLDLSVPQSGETSSAAILAATQPDPAAKEAKAASAIKGRFQGKPKTNLDNPLVQWRRKEDVSAGVVAEVLGVTAAAIAHYESGRNRLRDKNFAKLSALTGIDIAVLKAAPFKGKAPPASPEPEAPAMPEPVRPDPIVPPEQPKPTQIDQATNKPITLKLGEFQELAKRAVEQAEAPKASVPHVNGKDHYDRIVALETARHNHNVRLGTIEANVKDAHTYIDATNEELGALKNVVHGLKQQLDHAVGLIEDLRARVKTAEDRSTASQVSLRNLKEAIASRQAAKDALDEADSRLADWLKEG